MKDQAVMAVEAIEGTDEAILRGGKLAGEGAVVIKVAKPKQDMRFDVPVVGMNTLKSMIEVNARVLAIEAGKSILLQRKKIIKEADEAGISVVGYKDNYSITILFLKEAINKCLHSINTTFFLLVLLYIALSGLENSL